MMDMFLQSWTIHRITDAIAIEYPSGCGEKTTTQLKQDIEAFQFHKFKEILEYAYEKSPFYHELYSNQNFKPGDINSMADIVHVPFITATDLTENAYRLLCISISKIERTYTLFSSGTTGSPKRVFLAEEDLNGIIDYMGAVMKTVVEFAKIGEDPYRVFSILPNGKPASQAELLGKGVKKYGGIALNADITLNSEEQFDAMERFKPHVILCSVHRMRRMTQELMQSHDLRQLGVQLIFLTSEYLPLSTREEIKRVWDCDVYHHYGMTEMGFGGAIECSKHDGYHFNETDFLFEVVNPCSDNTMREGEGELVFSTLGRTGMPLIRYRTGDIACLNNNPCLCGASILKRIGSVKRRIGDSVKIYNGEIFPSLFDDVLYQISSIIDYRISVSSEKGKDLIHCKIETSDPNINVEQIVTSLINLPVVRASIDAGSMLRPCIEIAEPGELKRKGRAKQQLIDARCS